MRDLYKLVLLVPIAMIVGLFLFRMAPGDGELEFYANGTDLGASSGIRLDGGPGIDISATRGSHDVAYEISSTSPSELRYLEHQSPTEPSEPTLTIQGDAAVDVLLQYPFGGDTDKPVYTLDVDLTSIQAAVTTDAEIEIWNPFAQPAAGYELLRELRVEAQSPITLNSAYDAASDEMRFTFELDGGTAGQVVTSTGPSSNPIYADVPEELPTGATDRQVLMWDAGASPAAPVWEDVPAGLSEAIVTLSAADVAALDTTRIQVVAAPAAGQYLMPVRMVIIKTGGPDTTDLPSSADDRATRLAWQNTHISLAFDSSAGGLMGDPGPECIYDAWLANGSLSPSGWVANTDDYVSAFNLIPSSSGEFGGLPAGSSCSSSSSIATGHPLVIVGSAQDDDNGTTTDTSDDRTAAEVWDDYTATSIMDDLSLKLIVYYDTVAP